MTKKIDTKLNDRFKVLGGTENIMLRIFPNGEFTRKELVEAQSLASRGLLVLAFEQLQADLLCLKRLIVPMTEGVPEWDCVPDSPEITFKKLLEGKTEQEQTKIKFRLFCSREFPKLCPKLISISDMDAMRPFILASLNTEADFLECLEILSDSQRQSYWRFQDDVVKSLWNWVLNYQGNVPEAAEPILRSWSDREEAPASVMNRISNQAAREAYKGNVKWHFLCRLKRTPERMEELAVHLINHSQTSIRIEIAKSLFSQLHKLTS